MLTSQSNYKINIFMLMVLIKQIIIRALQFQLKMDFANKKI